MTDLKRQKNDGFTLIEVVAVLIIISIVGVIVATRIWDSGAELVAQTDVIKTHLRYAQSRAMSSNVIWGIVFNGNTYSLFRNGDATDTALLPGESSKILNLTSGISITGVVVAFDSWGRPYDNAAGTSLIISDLEMVSLDIKITKNTGFVQ
ncbi:prepilin-type N-terminal cleavage/methylation domain-containing protein [Thermodesulfobacteriota bacterium]